ncbi:MAG: hypothetical protein CL933_07635 [Deltaproteobacteria bacterium]|nr:hypothetical protein [Deltaproteobacteria bacterium]
MCGEKLLLVITGEPGEAASRFRDREIAAALRWITGAFGPPIDRPITNANRGRRGAQIQLPGAKSAIYASNTGALHSPRAG